MNKIIYIFLYFYLVVELHDSGISYQSMKDLYSAMPSMAIVLGFCSLIRRPPYRHLRTVIFVKIELCIPLDLVKVFYLFYPMNLFINGHMTPVDQS